MLSPVSAPRRPQAFSLIELITVMAIIVIIATFTVPAATTMIRGSQLTQASSTIADQFALARQQAMGRSKPIEVRIIRFADPEQPGEQVDDPSTGRFRAIQLMEINEQGIAIPLKGSNVQRIPSSVMISDNENLELSTLVTLAANPPDITSKPLPLVKASDEPTDPEMPRGVKKKYEYVAFQFRADGSTNLLTRLGNRPSSGSASSEDGVKWYLTIHNSTDVNKVKSKTDIGKVNFYTIQIDPVSGTTRIYKPTAG